MSCFDEVDLDRPDFADLYDELPLWSAPFGLVLLDRVPVRPGVTILDVGAGTGFLTVELAQRCGRGTRVIAVDPWKTAADRLRRKIARLGLEDVVVLEQDAATIDLPADSVDVIVSNLGVNNFDDPAAVLLACFRVAKPGALLILTTNLVGHMAEFYEAYRAALIDLGHHDRLDALEAHVLHRATAESVRASLETAGFELVETVPGSFRTRFANGSALLRHHFIRLGFVPGWKAVARPDALPETFAALERRLNDLARERGELALTVPMTCFVARKRAERGAR